LVAGVSAQADSSGRDAIQVVRACERLRIPLIRLAGTGGFSSLLCRALAMAQRQVPGLAGLRVGADGSLEGFEEISRDEDAAEAARRGGVVLLAELLGLLFVLIGEPLTLILVSEIWPEVSLETIAPHSDGDITEVES